ncbi:30S ribosomal protein S6e [Candidatus Woesearchaeota archaeon]|nr:30S ribosomal protein S6e [Candidatus Woesearchaeota archaeon]
MTELKLVINDVKNGKSYSKALSETESENLVNLKMKDKVKGEHFGFHGYEFEITGGTDKAGFPMRYDLEGNTRKKALLSKGPCVKIKERGMRLRKTIRGNTIANDTSQVNLKVLTYGKDSVAKLLGKEEELSSKETSERTEKKEKKE